MTSLTTSKIVNTIQDLRGALRRGPLHVFDTVYGSEPTKSLYDGTLDSKEYTDAFWKYHEASIHEPRGTLRPGADFNYKPNQDYYLVGPLKDEQADRVLHLRFENPGNDQIRSFHLTDEGGMTRLNPQRINEEYDMRGHLFFQIDGGRLKFCKVGGPRGSQNKQMSDARLFSYAPDVTALIYYWMYRI